MPTTSKNKSRLTYRDAGADIGPGDTGRVLEHLGDEARMIGALGTRGAGAPIHYSGKLAGSAR